VTEDELPEEEDLPEPNNEEEKYNSTVDSVYTWTAFYWFFGADCLTNKD
jgi:hypothetical protein